MAGGVSSDAAWLVFGAIALAVAGSIWIQLGPELPAARPSRSARVAGRSPIVWGVVVAYGAAGLGYIVPGTFLPAMAREIVPSPWIFGWGWPVFGAAAFVSTLVSAALHRRFSNRTIWGASQIAMAVGLLLPVLFPHILSIVAAALCVGGTFMVITMAGLREVHRIATSTDVARHVAVMTAAFAVGQSIGPVFASALHDATENFAPSLIATSIFLISTVALLARADPVSPCRLHRWVTCPHPTATVAYTGVARCRQRQGTGAHGITPGLLHHSAEAADGKRMTMTPEAWTVIGTGVVILIAIAAISRQLRGEMNALRGEMNGLRGEMNGFRDQMTDRMDGMHAEIGRLRERMAKLEGLLEGLREAITGRKVA
ncbi:MAG: YbfB/YjiJ family MFS transporter [Chromatiales bacterium]|nr:YbfB/YjiJ family MFS transporter [Chromatiales bacterium]